MSQSNLLGSLLWRGMVVPLAFVAAWGVATLGHPPGGLLASPGEFAHALIMDWRSGLLPASTLATLARALGGFMIGAAVGLAAGLVLGLFAGVRRITAPTLDAARQIALFAWIPLLSAWLGNGEAMKVTLIALGAFFPTALATAVACAATPQPYAEVGRTLELSRGATVRLIVLPAAAPAIVAGLELALNVAWLGTIGAEYLIGTGYINGMGDGLGSYLAQAREYARMDRILVGVLVLAFVGLALDRSVAVIAQRIFPWRNG